MERRRKKYNIGNRINLDLVIVPFNSIKGAKTSVRFPVRQLNYQPHVCFGERSWVAVKRVPTFYVLGQK